MSIEPLSLFFWILFFVFLLALFKRQNAAPPALPLSRSFLLPQQNSVKVLLAKAIIPLRFLALFLFGVALANPMSYGRSAKPQSDVSTKGVALYLLLDRSGSMQEKITPDVAKIDWVRHVTTSFIERRKNDMIGLVAFARKADLLSPLTLDHQALIDQLQKIEVAKTEAEDGTVIGYSIFKTVNLIVATRHFAEELKGRKTGAFSIKNQAIIVLTDGLQSPNPLDRNNPFRFMGLENAAQFAKENDVRLYFIGIVPRSGQEDFMAQMQPFKRAVLATGGQFYLTNDENALQDVYKSIDAIETSDIVAPHSSQQHNGTSLAPFVIGAALLLLVLSILIETCFARVIP